MDADGPSGQGEAPVHPDPPQVTHALEDLPEPARAQVTAIIGAVPRPHLWKRICDDLEDAAADAYGNLERVPLLVSCRTIRSRRIPTGFPMSCRAVSARDRRS